MTQLHKKWLLLYLRNMFGCENSEPPGCVLRGTDLSTSGVLLIWYGFAQLKRYIVQQTFLCRGVTLYQWGSQLEHTEMTWVKISLHFILVWFCWYVYTCIWICRKSQLILRFQIENNCLILHFSKHKELRVNNFNIHEIYLYCDPHGPTYPLEIVLLPLGGTRSPFSAVILALCCVFLLLLLFHGEDFLSNRIQLIIQFTCRRFEDQKHWSEYM